MSYDALTQPLIYWPRVPVFVRCRVASGDNERSTPSFNDTYYRITMPTVNQITTTVAICRVCVRDWRACGTTCNFKLLAFPIFISAGRSAMRSLPLVLLSKHLVIAILCKRFLLACL